MHVIVSFVGGWGHVEPLLPIAALAERRGHRVSFAGQARVVEQLSGSGRDVDVVGPDTLLTAPQPLVPLDRTAELAVVRDHFVTRFGNARAAMLRDLYDARRPGLAICDEVDVGAVLAAEQRGVPCATVNVIAAGLLAGPDVVGSAWSELRRTHGLSPDPELRRIGGELAVAPLPRSFRSPLASAPTTMRFVRPPILEDVRKKSVTDGNGRPLVYVTLGTVFNLESGDLLDRLVQAMNRVSLTADVDVVITTGPHIRIDRLPPPGPRVRVEAFIPQRELLSRCRAIVCHGGSGTIVAALSHGIPVVVLPMGADQPDNADRCRELGVGIALDPLTATPGEVAEATDTVRRDARFASAAAALAAEAAAQISLEELPELENLLPGPPERRFSRSAARRRTP